MPTISRFYGIRIRMYFDELHGLHFHADYAGESAQISLVDGRVMSGRLPVRAFRLVSDWASEHHSELFAASVIGNCNEQDRGWICHQ